MKNAFGTRSKLAKFSVAAGLFALSCTAICGRAVAQVPTAAKSPADHATPHEMVTYRVRYSDLDVSTMIGAKILYLRIRYAAETLCESAASWGKKDGEACVRKAIYDAVARVDAPLLTQYNQLRSKRDKAGILQLANAN